VWHVSIPDSIWHNGKKQEGKQEKGKQEKGMQEEVKEQAGEQAGKKQEAGLVSMLNLGLGFCLKSLDLCRNCF